MPASRNYVARKWLTVSRGTVVWLSFNWFSYWSCQETYM